MPTFSELLTQYIQRSGITDAELARGIGVRRQTIFRWKEGLVERPRHRDDVLHLAKRLRLTAEERDGLLIAAGFPPERMPPLHLSELETKVQPQVASSQGDEQPESLPEGQFNAATHTSAVPSVLASTSAPSAQTVSTTLRSQVTQDKNTPDESQATLLPSGDAEVAPGKGPWQRLANRAAWRWAIPALGLLVLLLGLGWGVNGLGNRLTGATPTPLASSIPLVELHAPTPPPTATPYHIVATEGETLLLVATFANYAGNAGFNIAGRIEEALDEQIAKAKLEDIRVIVLEEKIGNATRAEAQLAAARAAMLLWGEYDSARVVVNFAVRGDLENPNIRRDLQSLDELPAVINHDVPQQVRSLALFTLGQLFRGEGKLEQAKAALENALTLNPSDELAGKIYFYLGSVYGQGTATDLDKSINHYSEAIALRPTDANARYNRGLVFWNRYRRYTDSVEDLDSAIADFGQTITLKPGYAKAFLNRGAAYYDRSNFKQTATAPAGRSDIQRAIADFGRVIQLTPDDYDAYFNRGLAYIRAGDDALWLTDLQKAQELATPARERDIHTALCWGYTLAQQPQDALSNCQQAAEMDPDQGDNEDSLGIVYTQLGDLDKAAEHFSNYLKWLKAQPPGYYIRYRGPLVEEWIVALRQGDNPITADVLKELR